VREVPLPAGTVAALATLGDALEQDGRIVFAYLFGSAARGRLTPLSDVDVAVFIEDSSDAAGTRLEILDAVSRHLRTDRVDVVILNRASTAVAGRVLLDRRVLVDRKPGLRHQYESLTLRMFHDFRRLEHAILKERFGG
jgi:uncharacterized protein